MKKENLFEALGDIDEEKVKAAGEYRKQMKPVGIRRGIAALCAAAVLIVLTLSGIFTQKPADTADVNMPSEPEPSVIHEPSGRPLEMIKVMAAYPEAAEPDTGTAEFMESDAHWKWMDSMQENIAASRQLQGDMENYYMAMMEKMLKDDDANTVCSPLNIYIALGMLAEVTDGTSRGQILELLNTGDIETLRNNIHTLWNSNYADTPALQSLLADSIWLNNAYSYKQDTMQRLADIYYASSFSGVPGTEEMNEELRKWTDDNTGGLLHEYVQGLELSPQTVMALVSTIYYKAMWNSDFNPKNTSEELFHGIKGDTKVNMMHMTDLLGVYRTDAFTSIGLSLTDSGAMHFYLPNEGKNINDLVSDPDIIKATKSVYDEHRTNAIVHMSIPKFNVSSKTNLTDVMKELGITDVFEQHTADFSPLSDDTDIYVDKAEHAAMVEIDEHGVVGAAYTALITEGAAEVSEEINFVLDRPFMFVITGADGSVLFTGIVRNIE